MYFNKLIHLRAMPNPPIHDLLIRSIQIMNFKKMAKLKIHFLRSSTL